MFRTKLADFSLCKIHFFKISKNGLLSVSFEVRRYSFNSNYLASPCFFSLKMQSARVSKIATSGFGIFHPFPFYLPSWAEERVKRLFFFLLPHPDHRFPEGSSTISRLCQGLPPNQGPRLP